MLFYGDEYYPAGGWEDFYGYFDSVEEAEKTLLSLDPSFSWGHIVKDGKIVKKYNSKVVNEKLFKHDHIWQEEGLD